MLTSNQAHAFAGAFLLPANSFIEDFYVPTLDAHIPLKAKWGVSIQALIMREHRLDLITDQQKQYLFINISKRKWKTKEPLDDEQEIEQPLLTSQAIQMLISNGVQSRSAIVNGCAPESETDIEALAGLQRGYLSESQPPIPLPRIKSKRLNERTDIPDDGGIIDFPQHRIS